MRKRKKIFVFGIILIAIILYSYAGYRPISSFAALPLKFHDEFKESDLIKQFEDSEYIASIYANVDKNILFTVVRKTIIGYKILVVSEMIPSQKVFDYRIIYPDSSELKMAYYGFINEKKIAKLDFCNQSSVPLYSLDNTTKIFFGVDYNLCEEKRYTMYDEENKILLRLKDGKLINNLHS